MLGIITVFSCSGGVWAPVRSALDAGRLDLALVAYDRASARDGHDPEVVVQLAALLLRQSVQSGDGRLRDAAVTQLRLATDRGHQTLRELLAQVEPGVAQVQVADALVTRAESEDKAKYIALIRSNLGAADARARRIALRYAEVSDRAVLEKALGDADETVRGAALRRMSKLESQGWMLAAAQVALRSHSEHVRRAAVNLFVRSAEERGPVFALFADPDPRLRLEVLRALAKESDLATDEALLRLIAAQLVWPPSPVGIAAAQVLARRDPLETHLQTSPIAAIEYLQRVLQDSSVGALRAQAAVALILVEPSLPLRHFVSELLGRTAATERDLRLQLTRVLLVDEPAKPRAFTELQALLDRCDVPGVQASVLLVEHSDGALAELGVESLQRCSSIESSPDRVARRTAARALSVVAGRSRSARSCLVDPDPIVRIFCAGGIVARAGHDD